MVERPKGLHARAAAGTSEGGADFERGQPNRLTVGRLRTPRA